MIGLELSELWHLTYPRLLGECGKLVFFLNSNRMEFKARYSALFCHYSLIEGFRWLWMERLCKSIQLIMVFLKAPFLLINFFYHLLMTFLMMPSVKLVSMLMILHSTLTMTWHMHFLATILIGFWTWIWCTRHCRLRLEKTGKDRKNSTYFV